VDGSGGTEPQNTCATDLQRFSFRISGERRPGEGMESRLTQLHLENNHYDRDG